ncbi:flagellar basal body rod modification protein [bacterium]|nr:flagellar basal body rod modification protein [bacterium]
MKIRLVILMAAVAIAIAASEFTADAPSAPVAAQVPAPAVAPPMPDNEPSRRQTGGPDERLAWETMLLADPATGRIPPDIHRRERAFAARLPERAGGTFVAELPGAPTVAKLAGWTYRGPWNIGGRTRALAIDVADPTFRTLLAGGISGGMWRTTDEGANWTLTTGSSQLHAVSSLAQDTRAGHEDVWYYGTGEIRGNSAGGGGAPYRGDGVFKSVDGGASWSLLASTAAADPTVFSGEWQYVHRLAVDAGNAAQDEVYAAVYGFIERSTDGGASWTRVLGNAATQSRYTDVVVSSTGVVYASLSSEGAVNGVFRSPDGITWTDITPAGLTSHNRIVLALAPSDESILYMLVSDLNGTSAEGFYKYQYLTGDGSGVGGFWWNRSAQMALLPGPSGNEPMECYSSYCQTVTVNPTNPDHVYIGGIHLIRSTDGFATNNLDAWIGGWQYANHHADQHWLVFRPGSSVVAYTGSDGGVHRTTDITAGAVNWSSLSNGYNTSQFYTVAIDENLPGSDIVIGGMQDNGTWFTASTVGTQPWSEILGGDGSYCAVGDASGASGMYLVSVQNGVVYRMTVDNATGSYLDWTRIDPTGGGSYLFINPFIMDPNDDNVVFVGSSAGVWRNNDVTAVPLWGNGTTSVNWDHLTLAPSGSSVTALAMTRAGSRTLYYGTASGGMYRVDNADTAPAGTVPTALNMGPDFPAGGYVADIAIDPADDDHLLVAVSNYAVSSLFASGDGGATWTAVEGNLAGADGPSVRTVAIVPWNFVHIYLAGTSTGLYSTFALAGAATKWTLESPDLMGNVVVGQLKTRADDGVIIAGTHGKGVYGLAIPAAVAVPDDVPQPARALAQNVPNPFNPLTHISFELPADGTAHLAVYDIGGRLVRTLVDGAMAAGDHTVAWNGTDDAGRAVAAGIYLYRLRSGAVDEVRRMSLVR